MTHLVVRQEDGWAPGQSDDDTFTHIFPGARAVHRRVRLIRAAVTQSGLTLECAWHVDAAEKQTFLQATLDDNKRRFGKGKYSLPYRLVGALRGQSRFYHHGRRHIESATRPQSRWKICWWGGNVSVSRHGRTLATE